MSNHYKLNRIAALVAILLLIGLNTMAQRVGGRVTDARSGEGLAGVTVLAVGTATGTTTDGSGNYSLALKEAGTFTIRFSAIGSETKEARVTVGAGAAVVLNMQLAEAQSSLSEVVVVGSRSTQVRTSTETVAPVDVIQSRDLVATGQVEPTQQLNFVAPSFNSSRQTVADGTDHIDPATIRGLGPDQVLVLLNGKRRHNQALININGTVGRGSVGTDLNSIPSAAIERIEVLRDGAASQYGSDAIAGVINLRLKEAKGTTVNAQVGQQYAGDGQVAQIGVNHGIRVGKEGIISLTGELRYRGATNRAGDYNGPVYVNWNVGRSTGETDAAYIARRQTLYNQDQALIRSNNFNLSDNMQIGNSQVTNGGLFANIRLPFNGRNLTFYATGGVNYREGKAAGFYRYPFQTSQVIRELYPNGFLPNIQSTIWDQSLLVGLSGERNGWRYDISNVYGGNSFRFDVTNSNNASQFALGASAQRDFYAATLGFYQNTADLNVAKDFGAQIGLKSFNVAGGLTYRLDRYQIKPGEEASYRNYDPASGRAGGAQVFPGYQPANAINATRNMLGAYLDLETDLTEKFLVNVAGRYENYSDFGGNFAAKLAARYKFTDFFSLRGAISNGFRAPSLHQRYFSAISTVFVSTGTGLEPRQTGTFRNDGPIAQAFGVPSLGAERSNNYSVGITSKPLPNISLTVDAYWIDIFNRIIYSNQFTRGTSGAGLIVANILNSAGQQEVNAAQFFTNAVNTTTRGIDIVMATSPRLNTGTLDLTLAANFNETRLGKAIQRPTNLPNDATFGNFLFNRQDSARLVSAQPKSKIAFTANYRVNKFGVVLRFTRFGEVSTADPATPVLNRQTSQLVNPLDEVFSPKIITDLSVSYRVLKSVTMTLGANNLFDVYPDKLKATLVPTPERFAGTNSTTGLPNQQDNTSFGRFVYSRNATQFGFNGGYYFLNLSASF